MSHAIEGVASGFAAAIGGLIMGLTPPARRALSEWAAAKRQVSAESGSPFPGQWRNDVAPYLVEIQDCLGLNDPCRSVTFKKSAQVAGTEAGINLFGQVVDETQAPVLIVLPNLDEASKYVKVKLQPTIDATPCLREKVKEQKSRDSDGSTTAFKRFPGGFAQVTGANSSSGLQMISVRVLVCEEISEWPLDVGGRGDPLTQAEKRQTAWLANKKTFYNSTPKIVGLCRITTKFEASDQRRYYVPCPHCDDRFVLAWKHMKWRSEEAPYKAYVSCPSCGCDIEHWQKAGMVARGTWLKTYPGDDAPPEIVPAAAVAGFRQRSSRGREPGFHIWQAYSNLVNWDDTVAEFKASEGDPESEKTFVQQVLGLAYEMKGDAPEHELLMARRENWPLGQVQPGVLIITVAVDVQKLYMQYEVVGWGVGKTSWSIEKGILEGNTAITSGPGNVWDKLAELYERRWPDATGRMWAHDMMAVDAGYQTHEVYNFVRKRPKAMAVDGREGHLRPPIGTPTKQDVTFGGRTIKAGVLLWPVGSWSLKGELYANLAKPGPLEGAPVFPPGYCHFCKGHDEAFFKQLTAEKLVAKKNRRGQTELVWEKAPSQANEALDVRVYARAAAEHLGISRLTREDWARLAKMRDAPLEGDQMDLAAYWSGVPGEQPAAVQAGTTAATRAEQPAPAPAGAARATGRTVVRGARTIQRG